MKCTWPVLIVSFLTAIASLASAETLNYYVGLDSLETLASGTYAGLSNPNVGRLTFLVYPGDHDQPKDAHYHGIGAYSYTGDVGSPTINSTNANNRLPETHTGQAPLTLLPGAGDWSGKLVSLGNLEHYGDLETRSTQDLSGYAAGTLEAFLFNSSGGRWSSSLEGAEVWLELVSKSPGLHVGAGAAAEILANPGDQHLLGPGNALDFLPVFWTAADAAPGTYSAQFRLHDLGAAGGRTPFGSSGTFNFDFAVVPEPGALWVAAIGLVGLAVGRRRLARR
jgi:hypothetical protein